MSEEKNGESEPPKEQIEKLKLNEEQYKLLLSCSEKKDITEWDKYRKERPDEEIILVEANLQGADLQGANLQGAWLFDADLQDAWLLDANLQHAHLGEANLQNAKLKRDNLRGADLWRANLQGAWLSDANLQGAHLDEANLQDAVLVRTNLQGVHLKEANLQGADLQNTNLQGADLQGANLQGAKLEGPNLSGADLKNANLQGADLQDANLQGAKLCGAKMQGAKLRRAKLQGVDFTTAIVDGGTLIWECAVNRYSKSGRFTDFEGVGLDSVRIDPETKQLLEYNVRRKNWEEWYKGKSCSKWIITMRRLATSPIRLFWSISDYGLSTGRIMLSIILLVVAFATIYFGWGWVDCYLFGIKDEPGIVRNLFIAPQAQQQMSDVYYCLMIYFRSVCFSVATMFSFGDISVVNTQLEWKWWFSHLVPIVQMVTGYMLLGALITRFAVLFTAGGPAGTFTPIDKETKVMLGELNAPMDKETEAIYREIKVLSRKLKYWKIMERLVDIMASIFRENTRR